MTKLIAFLSVYNERGNIKEILDQIYDHVDKVVIVDGRYKHFPGESLRSYGNILVEFAEYLGLDDFTSLEYSYTHQKLAGHQTVEKKIKDLPVHLIFPSVEPWPSEMIKRSIAFYFGYYGDWFLFIDGDERIREADWSLLKRYLDPMNHKFEGGDFDEFSRTLVLGVPFYDYKTGIWHYAPRFIRAMPHTRFYGNHYTLEIQEVDPALGIRHTQTFFYDILNDASRRRDIDLISFNHLNRKERDPVRFQQRLEYYHHGIQKTERATVYEVGENRYHRQSKRFDWEPIHQETFEQVKKAMEKE
ncbi:MAG: hypothetical protein ACXADF_14485 [Candidatus Thorarchaeota archaeon]|jgi:hypothetical protein